jgi:hypothetical protein
MQKTRAKSAENFERLSEKVAAGFPACRSSGFQPQVGWRTGGKMPPSLATNMVAATFSDEL